VVPLVGPSSILLAIMGSGLNGQCFAFNGYLPIPSKERINRIKQLELKSIQDSQSQVFMETPYRNQKLFNDLLNHCHPETDLCVATDLTLPTEFIKTKKIRDWKKQVPDINKRPTIFIFQG
jgi:16S rRNA (cytidine1402-2'-O)-methyltransferase